MFAILVNFLPKTRNGDGGIL